ncbi:MAG: FAD binding domain-containing protein [Chloroflexi bacterium]|nr:FAD binding domain-containing protein [Chloroflexota bacterium]
MQFFRPSSLREALEIRAAHPEAVPIAGGTDLMVEVNFGRRRPEAFLDISRLPELREIRREGPNVRLGSGVPYARVIRELPDQVALAQASRTVGSPQIRTRGTVGGNLGTGSPAGDALPVLAAYDARVVLRSSTATRTLAWRDFLVGPKRTALAPDELIVATEWERAVGPGSFSKVGTRNAMVIAIAGLCLQLDEAARGVRVALGSVGPTILRAPEAETFAAGILDEVGAWSDRGARVPEEAIARFGELVSAAARPIDDVRGTGAYRRHACAVLATRALTWALDDRRAAAMEAAS